jgi:hypothetical protein
MGRVVSFIPRLRFTTGERTPVPIGYETAWAPDPVWTQRLEEKSLRTIGHFPRRTPVRELHVAFEIPYVYDFITKLCRQQAEVIQNHINPNVRNIGQGEAQNRKYKRLKLGGCQAYD